MIEEPFFHYDGPIRINPYRARPRGQRTKGRFKVGTRVANTITRCEGTVVEVFGTKHMLYRIRLDDGGSIMTMAEQHVRKIA